MTNEQVLRKALSILSDGHERTAGELARDVGTTPVRVGRLLSPLKGTKVIHQRLKGTIVTWRKK